MNSSTKPCLIQHVGELRSSKTKLDMSLYVLDRILFNWRSDYYEAVSLDCLITDPRLSFAIQLAALSLYLLDNFFDS